MQIATGVDLIDIARVQEVLTQHGERFLQRVYSAAEINLARGNVQTLAARFAAKEAVAKALGTGIGAVTWHEIEILRSESGEPMLQLSGQAARIADERGLVRWSISLTHTQNQALAFVVALGE
ncbi:MAG: holo-ACP synthase [Anaerolineales bacterium]|nr:holo-ACP synthase [Anaerolineales bacterium]